MIPMKTRQHWQLTVRYLSGCRVRNTEFFCFAKQIVTLQLFSSQISTLKLDIALYFCLAQLAPSGHQHLTSFLPLMNQLSHTVQYTSLERSWRAIRTKLLCFSVMWGWHSKVEAARRLHSIISDTAVHSYILEAHF